MTKKLFLFAALGLALLINHPVKAQVSININIGAQPLWGPTGYNHVDYYYLPDIDVYYYVPSGQYVYLEGNRWVWRTSLPVRYRNYNLYNAYKVVMNSPKPYLQHNIHVTRYKNHAAVIQPVIRDSRDSRYNVVKGHANYNGGNRPVTTRPSVSRPVRTPVGNVRPSAPASNTRTSAPASNSRTSAPASNNRTSRPASNDRSSTRTSGRN